MFSFLMMGKRWYEHYTLSADSLREILIPVNLVFLLVNWCSNIFSIEEYKNEDE